MRTRFILRALVSHWRRAPLQLFTLLAGLALATALWTGVQAINAEARASYGAASDRVGLARLGRITAAGDQPLVLADYVALRRAGWLVTPQIEGVAGGGSVRVLGIDPLTAQQSPQAMGGSADITQLLGANAGAMASADAATVLDAMGVKNVISPGLETGTAIMDIGLAARFLERGDVIDRLIVLPEHPIGRADLTSVAPHLAMVDAEKGADDIARLTDSFHLNLTAFGLLSFAVGLFIVYGAIGLAFEQRRAMFRTLRALGVPLRDLITVLALELTLLALGAGAFGVALGYGVAAALLPDVAATLRGLYGADVTGQLQIRAAWWLSGLGMALGGTALASAGTFWRLTQLPLLDAGLPQAWAAIARRMIHLMAICGAILLLLVAGLGGAATTLVQGFVLLGALLIGAALMLPLMLDRLLGLLARLSPPPLPAWFWSDTRAQIPGLSMALMALLLAIAANIGVSTMVSSFRLTFTGWLDQRLAAELYVTTEDADQAQALERVLEGQVDAILPLLNTPAQLGAQAGDIYAVADHATYRDHWPLLSALPDVWSLVQKSGYALVNEQLALRTGVELGDPVPGLSAFEVVGIYSDYGNPAPQIIIGLDVFKARYPQVDTLRFGIRVDTEQVGDVITLLRTKLGLPETAIADQARIKAMSLGIFEQTFRVTAALNVLTLGVAGFSILMSLLTLSQMRLPQVAPVWALGVTRLQLGRMETLRAIALAGLVTLLALPLGLALAWVLMSVVNVAAFGWRLPMFFFPGAYAMLALAALVAALLAALWPAWRLARTAPHRLLQVFSSGR